MRHITKFTLITLLLLGMVSSVSYAAVPHLINYQGKLTDSTGKPLTGAYNVTFKIYDNAGTPLWTEARTGVVVDKGIFNVQLGGVTPFPSNLAFDQQYYLGIQVGSDTEMTPRQQLSSSGYALRAENADNATNAVQAQKIEARTSDPSSPVTGQMWLRTDL